MAVERSELKLVWPPDLFVQEARALLAVGHTSEDSRGFLLSEAFHADRGFRLFQEIEAASPRHCLDDPWSAPALGGIQPAPGVVELVTDLVEGAGKLPRYERPLYYSARRNPLPEPTLVLPQVMAVYAQEVARLARAGYFDDAFGSTCCDAGVDPDAEGQRQLSA